MEQYKNSSHTPMLFIAAGEYKYATLIKNSLEEKFGTTVFVNLFKDARSILTALNISSDKPRVLLIDHGQNIEMPEHDHKHAVEIIKESSPETAIIILADEKDKAEAVKSFSQGTSGFVLKDQFALAHIYTAIEKCLHPVKM
jgi:DNA-binding NarL/FixJ family response regulator